MSEAARKYRAGDILRSCDDEEFLVVEDGVDECGQVVVRPLGSIVCLTPKVRRFRRISRRSVQEK